MNFTALALSLLVVTKAQDGTLILKPFSTSRRLESRIIEFGFEYEFEFIMSTLLRR